MASVRQIAANRRNARKSTGPRSQSGRRRAARNSFKHGLASGRPDDASNVEDFARRMIGDEAENDSFEIACVIAEAQLKLDSIRRIRVNLIENALIFNDCESLICTEADGEDAGWEFTKNDGLTMAIKRAFDDILGTLRYEARAARRRDKAVKALAQRRCSKILPC